MRAVNLPQSLRLPHARTKCTRLNVNRGKALWFCLLGSTHTSRLLNGWNKVWIMPLVAQALIMFEVKYNFSHTAGPL